MVSISLASLCAAAPYSAFAIPQTPTADAAQHENADPSHLKSPNANPVDLPVDDADATQHENANPSHPKSPNANPVDLPVDDADAAQHENADPSHPKSPNANLVDLPVGDNDAAHQTAPDMTQLSKTIAQLQTGDAEAMCGALNSMARLCDQQCVPYIADALRHDEPRVVRHAADVARILAHPRLLPALESVIWNHYDDEVRIEALRAAIAIIMTHDDDSADDDLYRALFDALRVERLDELLRKLVRSLPENLRSAYADSFVQLAQDSSFVSSVVAAYQNDPKTLFDALCYRLPQAPNDDIQKQWIRTARILVEQNSNFLPNPASYETLSLLPASLDEDVAVIMAALSTPIAAQWLVAHLCELSAPTQYAVFQFLHDDAAEIVTRTLLNHTSQSRPEDACSSATILSNPSLADAFIAKIPPIDVPEIRSFIERLFDFPSSHGLDDRRRAALPILRAFSNDADMRQRVLSLLGHSDPNIAYAAHQVAASHPAYWNDLVDIVESNPDDDAWGKPLLARYALAQIAASTKRSSLPHANTAADNAKNVLKTPSRLHALPALWLLRALDVPFVLPNADDFNRLRPEMKRAFIESLPELYSVHENIYSSEDNLDKLFALIRAALSPTYAPGDADAPTLRDPDAASAALWTLSQMPSLCNLASRDDVIVDQISIALQSDDLRLSAHASLAIAQCAMSQFIPQLNNRIVDPEPVVAYNALVALQKLRALPDEHWLKMLYYRTNPGFLRDKLAFFAGVGTTPDSPNPRLPNAARDLETGNALPQGQIALISSQNRALPQTYIQVMLENQSVVILKSSHSGFFYVPE